LKRLNILYTAIELCVIGYCITRLKFSKTTRSRDRCLEEEFTDDVLFEGERCS